MADLGIADVAERTGIAAGTLRMWEQRYGYPEPMRTPSGYRRYDEEIVEILRRVAALRERGLSVQAAIDEARGSGLPTDRPSIYAAVAPDAPRQLLRKRTLIALSRAIEDEAIAHAAAPICFGAFQRREFLAPVEHRYREMARMADAIAVFADFEAVRERPDGIIELPIAAGDALGNEWAVVVDAPGYSACLLAWEPSRDIERGGEHDLDRRFECLWTIDPLVTRNAARMAARLAGRCDAAIGERLEILLADRPLASDQPAPALTALTNRAIAYLEA